MTRHYLDHASISPLRPEAAAAMAEWAATGVTADPGRVHTEGRMARAMLEEARDRVAGLFGVRPRQLVFTSGATEAVNSAVWGALRAWEASAGRSGDPTAPPVVVAAAVERAAVREASARLATVVSVPVDGTGRIDPDGVRWAIGESRSVHGTTPALVHCQWANHEVGTLQPVGAVAAICSELGVLLHVDAVAAAGHVPVDCGALDADFVSVAAHQLGGPPGIGALILRRGLRIEPLLVGGEQERARRAGLENVPAAVGFGAAAGALADPGRLAAEARASSLRTAHLRAAALTVDDVVVYGDPDPAGRLPHIVCLGIGGVEAEPVLLGLDQAGVAAHSGSSCSSESLEPSPVLEAMGVDAERSLRLSVGWSTTDGDVAAFASSFPGVVGSLRSLRS